MENKQNDGKRRISNKLLRNLWRSKTGLLGFSIVSIVVLMAILAPLITPHDTVGANPANLNQPPFWLEGGSMEHILGTDNIGRGLLCRVLYVSRNCLFVERLVFSL